MGWGRVCALADRRRCVECTSERLWASHARHIWEFSREFDSGTVGVWTVAPGLADSCRRAV
eukprot:scaffold8307_cov119-Isochrysis_galbana.AAC.12